MAGRGNVEGYLASLPGGVAAHPQCEHKGEALAVWLQRSAIAGLARRLPPEVAPLVDPAFALPAWVSEVHACVLYLALREQFADDDTFVAHARACNRAVLDTPANRVLFWCASPRALLRASALRWGSLHRGSSIQVRMTGDTSAEVALHFPARLLPEIVLQGNATGFAVALENAGARDVVLRLRDVDTTRALFVGRWR